MNKSFVCLFGGALLGAGLASPAAASITIDGTLVQSSSNSGGDYGSIAFSIGPTSVDTWDISVLTGGIITFDILSYEVFDAWFNSYLYLFANDGNPLSAENYIAFNGNIDDYVEDLNGSVRSEDSFLEIFLEPGEYTISVSTNLATIEDVSMGVVASGFILDGGGNGLPTEAYYQLDVFGDVALVPAPGAMALLGIGGLAATRRRR